VTATGETHSSLSRKAAVTTARRRESARSRLRDHGLSIVLLLLFAMSFAGQAWAGWAVYNEDQRQHGETAVGFAKYLRTGHFGEATFENWESEFLQMACFVLLTVFLFQRGSAESKDPDEKEDVDADPREAAGDRSAPWPVRRGGFVLRLYEHSLTLAFGILFALTFVLHGLTGLVEINEERTAHGEPALALAGYMGSSQFWFESMQNWQSEFLSLAAMVVLTIFLRERGSPESKPVATPHWESG
jgi:hypothetical protein